MVQYDWSPSKKRARNPQGRRPCKDRGSAWSDADTRQETPRTLSTLRSQAKARSRGEGELEYSPADTLAVDFWSPEL